MSIQAYELRIEMESSESHPDALTDLVNRASTAFIMAVNTLKNHNIELFNIMQPDDIDDSAE